MMNYRRVARRALAIVLALSISGCLLDPELDGSQNAGIRLAITIPSAAPTLDTQDTAISLAGTASSDVGISRVFWRNNRSGAGLANGTESWQIGNIDLQLGANIITITAEDTFGALSNRSIIVNRESGQTGSATLSWVAPTARTDGSPLTNLGGYKIYYGRMSGVYDYQINISNPGVLTYVVEDLMSGDWYFSLAAYDSAGIESDRSNEALRNIS
jgi:hypothetical protein